ncbi:HNH/endonuclease VII fold putative polymorphic toxin [Bacillus sp. NPDC077411]
MIYNAHHSKGRLRSHFNVRPADKHRTVRFECTQEHYPFNK